MANPEVGWYRMELTEVGQNDPLFINIPKIFEGFSTHVKEVNLNGVADNITLVKNNNCIQAVKYCDDPPIYGVQFHPDDTFESTRRYLGRYDEKKKGKPTLVDIVDEPSVLYGEIIFKNFIDMI